MCKWYELESGEIECAYCGKIFKKKLNPSAQMMAHSQYCKNKNYENWSERIAEKIHKERIEL